MDGFTLVDFAAAALVGISALIGLGRGLVREVLGAGAWIGALLATVWLFADARPIARDLVGAMPYGEVLGDVIAGGGVFLVSLIILSMISSALASLVRDTALSGADRILGLGFGAARGAAVAALAYAAFAQFSTGPQPAIVANAQVRPWLEAGAGMIRALMPEDLRRQVDRSGARARDDIDQLIGGRAPAAAPAQPPVQAGPPIGLPPPAQVVPSVPGQTPPPIAGPGAGGRPSAGAPAQSPAGSQPSGQGGYAPADRQGVEQLIRSQP